MEINQTVRAQSSIEDNASTSSEQLNLENNQAERLSEISLASSHSSHSRASQVISNTTIQLRSPSRSNSQNSLSFEKISGLAEQTIYQNQKYRSDINKLTTMIKTFEGNCPPGGYSKQNFESALNIILKMNKRYTSENDKSEDIKEKVNLLKAKLGHATNPDLEILEKEKFFASSSKNKACQAVKNKGFDTEKMAQALSDIIREKNQEKTDLLNNLASDLIDHFKTSDSIYKRIPIVSAYLSQNELDHALDILEKSEPKFNSLVKEYQKTGSNKALNAIKAYLDLSKNIYLKGRSQQAKALYMKALSTSATSSNQKLTTLAKVASKAMIQNATASARKIPPQTNTNKSSQPPQKAANDSK